MENTETKYSPSKDFIEIYPFCTPEDINNLFNGGVVTIKINHQYANKHHLTNFSKDDIFSYTFQDGEKKKIIINHIEPGENEHEEILELKTIQ